MVKMDKTRVNNKLGMLGEVQRLSAAQTPYFRYSGYNRIGAALADDRRGAKSCRAARLATSGPCELAVAA
jgi:hypothetical protein